MAEISKEESQTRFDLHGFFIEDEEGKCSECSEYDIISCNMLNLVYHNVFTFVKFYIFSQ